jgi:uncharacterized Zn finger protein (UPF0148 family)
MSLSRPKLTLDEQSFQDMLSAAFTIQEHNTKRKKALQPVHVCEKCGSPTKEGELLCAACDGKALRPGEELQRKWASLWLMSQEQELFPERSAQEHEAENEHQPAPVGSAALRISEAPEIQMTEDQAHSLALEEEEQPAIALAELAPAVSLQVAGTVTDVEGLVPEEAAEETAPPASSVWDLRGLRLRLRFHRADLYLVLAIMVSTIAMLWVLLATPASVAQRKPRLRPWERALVSMGLAEAPEAPPQRGNPAIQVWVDPRSALYYCAGEEGYGKTPGGRLTTQGEAQMESFEPASRAVCE